MTKPPLTLNEALHEYAAGGKPIPGVTNVIADCGLSDYSQISEERLERASLVGTYRHKMCEWYDKHDLNEATLDEQLKPFLEAWKKFRFDTGIKFDRIEAMDYDPNLWVAGQVDRTGTIGRKKVVIDIKPPGRKKWHAYQLAGYCQIFYPGGIPLRLTVNLKSDGTYKAEEFYPQDFRYEHSVFVSALTVWNARHS